MTVKELIENLKDAASNSDVLLFLPDTLDEDGQTALYEVKAVRAQVDMDHEGTRHTTYLMAGDEMADD